MIHTQNSMEKKLLLNLSFFFFIMNELLKIVFCFVSIPHIHYNFGFIPFCLKEKIMEIKKQLGKIEQICPGNGEMAL